MSTEELQEDVGIILEDDEEDIKIRLILIRNNLEKVIKDLRKQIPENISNEELKNLDVFKMWFLANNILNASLNNSDDDILNVMLYYMFKECDGNILKLITQFDVDLGEKTELLVLETNNEK